MKQYLHFFRACALIILLGAISSGAFSANIYSQGNGINGNWSSSAWLDAGRTGTITASTASNIIVGNPGTLFTTEINVGSVIKNNVGATIGTVLTVTDDTHLTLTGLAAINYAGAYTFAGIGSGDIANIRGNSIVTIDMPNATCAAVVGDNTFVGGWSLVFNAGTQLTVAGSVTVGDAVHTGSIDMTNGGTLKAASLTVSNAGTWTPGMGTVELTATNTLPATFFTTFNNLTISGGTTTTGGALTINGNLQIGDASTFTVGASFPLTVTGTTTIGTGATGVLIFNSIAGTKIFNKLVTINTGGTWDNSINSPVEFHSGVTNSGTLTWGTGVQTFNTNPQQLTGAFSIPNVTINGIALTNISTLTITQSLNGTGTLKQGIAASTLHINFLGPPGIAAIDATALNNTVDYSLAGDQTIYATPYFNLTVGGSGNKTLPAALANINGSFTLGGTAVATANSSLTIAGNVSTGAGTTLHAGDFTQSIGGDLINNGIFDGGTVGLGLGTIVLNGTASQTITNNSTDPLTHTVNITIDKTISTGTVLLGSDITAVNTLNMVNGNIILGGHNLFLGVSAATIGVLNYTAGSIVGSGKFFRWFPNTAIGSLNAAGLFPVGTTSVNRPLYISIPAGLAPGLVGVEYHDGTGTTDLSGSPVSDDGGASSIVVRKNFSWEISSPAILNPITYPPAKYPPIGDGTYNITAVGTNPGAVGSVSDLRLMLVSSVVGTNVPPGGGSIAAPQVTRTVANAGATTNLFNTFYIGSMNAVSSPLPITLLSFTASPVNGSVRLDWETTSEINNDHFTIQRSRNSVDWESIKVVPGAVNSSVNVKYSEYDELPYQGVSYYRLQQTDRDGKTSFSPIVSVKIGQSASINVYPNPTADHIWVTTVGRGKLNVALFNNNGRRINVPVTINGNTARLDVGSLSAGTYFVHILQGGQSESRVVMIAR